MSAGDDWWATTRSRWVSGSRRRVAYWYQRRCTRVCSHRLGCAVLCGLDDRYGDVRLAWRSSPRAFSADLHDHDQGFAIAYIRMIPLVLLAHLGSGFSGSRVVDLGALAGWAIVTAALVAHWIRTPIERETLHPSFSMPVVAGPFIAAISLQANGWNQLAVGLFLLGMFFWLMFGTLIVGRLMTERQLSERRFPSLAVLMLPPGNRQSCVVRLAWQSNHHCRYRPGLDPGHDGAHSAVHFAELLASPIHHDRLGVELPCRHVSQYRRTLECRSAGFGEHCAHTGSPHHSQDSRCAVDYADVACCPGESARTHVESSTDPSCAPRKERPLRTDACSWRAARQIPSLPRLIGLILIAAHRLQTSCNSARGADQLPRTRWMMPGGPEFLRMCWSLSPTAGIELDGARCNS